MTIIILDLRFIYFIIIKIIIFTFVFSSIVTADDKQEQTICLAKQSDFLFDIEVSLNSQSSIYFEFFRNSIRNITNHFTYSRDICYRLQLFIKKKTIANNDSSNNLEIKSCEDLLSRKLISYLDEMSNNENFCIPVSYSNQEAIVSLNDNHDNNSGGSSKFKIDFIITNTNPCPFLAQILASNIHLNENQSIKLFQPDLYPQSSNNNNNKSDAVPSFCKLFQENSGDKYVLERIKLHKHVIDSNTIIQQFNRILCVIYTIESRHDAIIAIIDTWGNKCTGFLAFSNIEDLSIPTIHIEHEGEESYENIWRKIVSIMKYVYNNYFSDFDWFVFAGDDTYFIMNNLFYYLSSDEIVNKRNENKGVFIGRQFKLDNSNYTYNTGGAGYILDNISLQYLYSGITSNSDICNSNIETSVEDVYVSYCLRNYNIFPYDTRDNLLLERFHHFSPEKSFFYNPITIESDWWASHMLDFKNGSDCCSLHSISFHNLQPNHMRAIDAYLHICLV